MTKLLARLAMSTALIVGGSLAVQAQDSGGGGSSTPQGAAKMPLGGAESATPSTKNTKDMNSSNSTTKPVKPGETPTNNPPSK